MIFTLPENVANNIQGFTGRSWLLPLLLEWLERSDDRVFILTGEPGTGKSMTTAWLAGEGPAPTEADASLQLKQVRSWVKATHFCIATSSNAPKAFAQNVAEQLTRTVPGFGSALANTLSDLVKISADLRINTVETGGSATGIYIEQLNLGILGDELSFDRALRDPLKRLYEGGYQEPMLLLVDALDESATYTGDITIARLLARLSGLSKHIRLLVTTRPDPRVLKFYQDARVFDLIKDAPHGVDDVRLYAYEQLDILGNEQRNLLADRISQAAEGIFLYASMVLGELQPQFPAVPDLTMIQFPKGLSGLYHKFLNRELGKDENRWYETFKPLLGLLAVAQGEGLSATQLSLISGKDVEQALRACKQYLNGDLPDGPFRPFHRSFVDFLLEEKENIDYHIDSRTMHQRIANYYRSGAPSWDRVNWNDMDTYGLHHLSYHLVKGFEDGIQQLSEMMNAAFMSTKSARFNTERSVLDDVRLAISAAREAGDLSLLLRWTWLYAGWRERIAQAMVPELLHLYVRIGQADWALDMIKALDTPRLGSLGEESRAPEYMAYALAEQGLVNEALSVARAISDEPNRDMVLSGVAQRVARQDQTRAIQMVRDGHISSVNPELCRILAENEVYLKDALEIAHNSGPAFEAIALQVAHRDVDRALAIINTIQPYDEDSGGERWSRTNDMARGNLALQIASSNPDQALTLLGQMHDLQEIHRTLIGLAGELAGIDAKRALSLVQLIRDARFGEEPRPSLYCGESERY